MSSIRKIPRLFPYAPALTLPCALTATLNLSQVGLPFALDRRIGTLAVHVHCMDPRSPVATRCVPRNNQHSHLVATTSDAHLQRDLVAQRYPTMHRSPYRLLGLDNIPAHCSLTPSSICVQGIWSRVCVEVLHRLPKWLQIRQDLFHLAKKGGLNIWLCREGAPIRPAVALWRVMKPSHHPTARHHTM